MGLGINILNREVLETLGLSLISFFHVLPTLFPTVQSISHILSTTTPHISLTTINPMERVTKEQMLLPTPTTPTVPTQKTGTSSRGKVKMMGYLKLNAPKYKEGDDPFRYIKEIKMIANELDTSDSRAI
ncbi:hypothetical protein P3X46_004688 [Hevea brasiliensis]|uniref:Ty3-gypsy retrotransposon protein n=1 Tax=Hevea brasiliensis TaxID=3981 RepID=A0ABQ9MZS8_HEVBR|nr:hypothetical protein P3X46_004688 [Hevea brasiliensis]